MYKLLKVMNGYKTLLINLGSLGISLTNIDVILKIILVGVTIGYTLDKWWIMKKNQNKNDQS